MKIEESLNGNYESLRGQIVDLDVYRMRDTQDSVSVNDPSYIHLKGHKRYFDFMPDVIIDLGANVGCFTNYCRKLFPETKIIAVEPDHDNFKYLQNYVEGDTVLLQAAIGSGKVFHVKGAINGAHECYITKSIGYDNIDLDDYYEESNVDAIQLNKIVEKYTHENTRLIIKIDIESGENAILSDVKEMEACLRADYFVMEYHNFAQTHEGSIRVKEAMQQFFESFSDTHRWEISDMCFYAVKK